MIPYPSGWLESDRSPLMSHEQGVSVPFFPLSADV